MCSSTNRRLLLLPSISVIRSTVSSFGLRDVMSLRALVFLNLILSVEKLITGHCMVVCQELGLEAAEIDMIFLELVLVE